MTRSSTNHRKSKTAASAVRPRRRSRPPEPRDEPKFEKYFDYGDGHTARILTPDEVVAIADGRYVPLREWKGSKAASAAHPPVASQELPPDPDYTVTFEDRFGQSLTMEDVIDFIEGRRDPP